MEETYENIVAKALIRILENQISIKEHIGLAKDTSDFGDCYYDREIIKSLSKFEYF